MDTDKKRSFKVESGPGDVYYLTIENDEKFTISASKMNREEFMGEHFGFMGLINSIKSLPPELVEFTSKPKVFYESAGGKVQLEVVMNIAAYDENNRRLGVYPTIEEAIICVLIERIKSLTTQRRWCEDELILLRKNSIRTAG
jgi:hypothetical protein